MSQFTQAIAENWMIAKYFGSFLGSEEANDGSKLPSFESRT
jgi:hypothetical protein